MTERQERFIASLLAERTMPEADAARLHEMLALHPDRQAASKLIEWLLKQPKVKVEATTSNVMPLPPEGRYALERDGVTKFYVLDCPTQGKWAGHVFLSALASDTKYPIRDPLARAGIIAEICEDPENAMLRYGQAIGRCGHCNRLLTDAASRAKGIGPICEGRVKF